MGRSPTSSSFSLEWTSFSFEWARTFTWTYVDVHLYVYEHGHVDGPAAPSSNARATAPTVRESRLRGVRSGVSAGWAPAYHVPTMDRARAIGAALAFALCLGPMTAAAQDVGIDVGAQGEGAADAETTAEADDAPPPDPGPQTDTERARERFARGIACIEEHETRCAIEHFEAALALHDAPAIRYNLASALFELRRYPEAARQTAACLAAEDAPEDIRGHCETLQTQLREQGGTIAITVSGSAEGAETSVDEVVIPPPERAAVVVAPGTRVVALTRDGEELARQEIEIAAGASESVELTAPPTPEEVAAQAQLEAEAEADVIDTGPEFYEEWPFWAIVGGSVALVTIIVIAAVVASDNASIEEPVSGNYDPGILRWD